MASDIDKNYRVVLQSLKEKIRQARLRAIHSVNKELLLVYWEIGNTILEQQKQEGWGTKVIDRLAADLKIEFPDIKGFSLRNIKYMRAFAEAYPEFVQQVTAQSKNTEIQTHAFVQGGLAQIENPDDPSIVQVPLAQLSWYHHITLLDKVKDCNIRNFYIQQTVINQWTRDVMVHRIESKLHERQGSLTNNFKLTMATCDSELTMQLFKDPYNFDFIMLGEQARERDLENALTTHVTKVLLELGAGFAFMGKQKRLEAGDRDFYADLLFYHTKLRRHIIIELKIGEFEPEFVSKMNVYLGLADDQLKGEFDQPSIGLILCKTKNKIIAEYALRDISKPIGIAEYKINQMLPEDIKGELPSIEEIETKLDEEITGNFSPVDERLKSVKEKIKSLSTPVIQAECSHQILQSILEKGLKPLYRNIQLKFNEDFGSEFLSQRLFWNASGKTIYGIDDIAEVINEIKDINRNFELDFNYALVRFKKGGTEDFNEHITLKFIASTTWYGFALANYNNQQAFLKKMYHEELTISDQQTIMDILLNQVLDRIEWIIEVIKSKR